jgi:hypothetical protein
MREQETVENRNFLLPPPPPPQLTQPEMATFYSSFLVFLLTMWQEEALPVLASRGVKVVGPKSLTLYVLVFHSMNYK